MSDGFGDLRRQLDEEGESGDRGYHVQLEPGDESVGWFLQRETLPGKYGEQPLYLYQDEQGLPCFLYGGTTVLDAQFAAADPQRGDQIVIRRLANKRGPNGEYYVFRVRAKKPLPGEEAPPLPDPPNDLGH